MKKKKGLFKKRSQEKIERVPKILKSDCIRTQAPGGIDAAKRINLAYVRECNHERIHSALDWLTSSDSFKEERP